LKKEEEIAKSQIKGKPENIVEKIVNGKIQSYYDQVCLFRQKYVKDSNLTIEQLVENHGKKIGKKLEILAFWRWNVGSGK